MYHVKADVMPELYWNGLIKYVNNSSYLLSCEVSSVV